MTISDMFQKETSRTRGAHSRRNNKTNQITNQQNMQKFVLLVKDGMENLPATLK